MNTRYTLAATASLALAACLTGCQQSGGARASVDVDRPRMETSTVRTETSMDTTGYTMPYVATNDTPWMRTSTDTTTAGTVRRGDVVYFRSTPPSSGTVAARTSDGRIVYVRAADFRPQ